MFVVNNSMDRPHGYQSAQVYAILNNHNKYTNLTLYASDL